MITSLFVANESRAVMPAAPGFLEGDLKIEQSRGVNLADEQAQKPGVNYAEFPLLILSKDGRDEVSRTTADENGHYRIALPPGDYVLEVKVRAGKRMGAESRSFTIVSKETVRVDMEISSGLSVSGASK
jgi:hypothetical protein